MTWAIYRPSNLQRRQIVLKPEQSLWYVLQHVVGQIPITENNARFPFHYIYIYTYVGVVLLLLPSCIGSIYLQKL